MMNYRNYLLINGTSIRVAMKQLNVLASDAIVFIVDKDDVLKGSLTDGDVRRGLLKGVTIDDPVEVIFQNDPKFVRKGESDIYQINEYREQHYKIIPVLDDNNKVVNVLNFKYIRSYLPVDAVVMAGGKGERLRPLTDNTPKPLLKVGDKAIMEHNIDRLALYGIGDFWFSIKYLGNQIVDYFGDGRDRNQLINYVWEDEPLGTIGAVSKIDDFKHDHILVTNSDILTNLDYEDFYIDFLKKDADFSVVSIPYNVSIPYAVLEISNNQVLDFKEKPTYTYFSNGGIYLIKRSLLEYIPKGKHFNATDLIEKLIAENKKVVSFPLVGYWLDVGKHADFEKAQRDINSVKF